MKQLNLYLPTTKVDLIRRSSIRVGFCTVPYLAFAWMWSAYRDDRFLHGFWFWWCVILIPLLGFALDFWRHRQTRERDNQTN